MTKSVSWTPALDAELHRLRATGLSWEQVARKLDLTKGQVLGRVLRTRKPSGPRKIPGPDLSRKIPPPPPPAPLPPRHYRPTWDD